MKRSHLSQFALIAALTGGTGSAVTAPLYNVTDLGTLGGTTTVARAINASGQITGYSKTASGNANAFIWSGGSMTALGTAGGCCSEGWDINASGHVAGQVTVGSTFHAALFSGGTVLDLGAFGHQEAYAPGIGNAGVLAIRATTPAGASTVNTSYSFAGGVATDIGNLGSTLSAALAMNNGGAIVGLSGYAGSSTDFYHAFVWESGVLTDIGTLGGSARNSVARGINDNGHVVGSSDNTTRTSVHAFFYDGVMHDLGVPSEAFGINNNDWIVGATFSGAGARAMLYEGGLLHDVNTLIDPLDPLFGQIILTDAVAINDGDLIVANGCLASEGCRNSIAINGCPPGEVCRSFLLRPSSVPTNVPEPSTLALIAGASFFWFRVRKLRTARSMHADIELQ